MSTPGTDLKPAFVITWLVVKSFNTNICLHQVGYIHLVLYIYIYFLICLQTMPDTFPYFASEP